MNAKNKIELTLQNFEKIATHLETDTPLGQIYDYACALRAFVATKIKELEDQEPKPVPVPEPDIQPLVSEA
jgi:hypothetical protein